MACPHPCTHRLEAGDGEMASELAVTVSGSSFLSLNKFVLFIVDAMVTMMTLGLMEMAMG